jgi:NTE family protein
VAGISVGAINAAIICGNPPERRRERLESFWRLVSSGLPAEPLNKDILPRTPFNEASAQLAASFGVPGFFSPRLPPSYLLPKTAPNAASYYVTSALRDTLTKLVDFDLLNSGATRLSVGAVNLTTGNFQYFDSSRQEIGPEHIMASGALPPAFPPIEIGGEHYWDGGLVSNTPLQYILDFGGPRQETCIFQIDLFSASGLPPANMGEVAQREKDIRYFSRTRMNTDVFRQTQTMRRAIRQLKHKLPAEFEHDEDWRELESLDVARRSPSCSSFIVAPLTRRKPKTTNSCAARWRTIGRPVGLTSRRRSRATLGATGCGRLRA